MSKVELSAKIDQPGGSDEKVTIHHDYENKHGKRSHVSARKFQQLVRLFSADLDASQIVLLTGLNRDTVNRVLI